MKSQVYYIHFQDCIKDQTEDLVTTFPVYEMMELRSMLSLHHDQKQNNGISTLMTIIKLLLSWNRQSSLSNIQLHEIPVSCVISILERMNPSH